MSVGIFDFEVDFEAKYSSFEFFLCLLFLCFNVVLVVCIGILNVLLRMVFMCDYLRRVNKMRGMMKI